MKIFIVSMMSICSILFVSACNTDTDNTTSEQEKIADELDPNREVQTPNNDEMNHQLGYVRYSKDELDMEKDQNLEARIDRPEMADMITKLILRNEGFDEVATLVTDEEVLIAYEKDRGNDTVRTAEIAKKTAESVMPSFYEVYVSDNESLMHDIQSLHNSSTNREYDNLINQLIKEMQKNSQGEPSEEDEM